MGKPTRVVLVDDSVAMRALLRELLADAADIVVVGEAGDAYQAREQIKALNPDVITLDVEMPRMNGIQFLENLMRLRPTPVVMFSSLTARGASVTLQALALGAVEVLLKPSGTSNAELESTGAALKSAIRTAAVSRPRPRRNNAPAPARLTKLHTGTHAARSFYLMGASTGGTEAIREVLQRWQVKDAALLITQHIPPAFSASFAERLDGHSPLHVRHATDGQVVMAGHAYVAPGGLHMRMVASAQGFCLRLSEDEPVNRHRPSVDVLFESARPLARDCRGAALLTGMGEDGARGLLALREAGVRTVAQDEASSVVWGMPGSAVRLGAAEHVLPLDRIADHLASLHSGAARRSSFAAGRRQESTRTQP